MAPPGKSPSSSLSRSVPGWPTPEPARRLLPRLAQDPGVGLRNRVEPAETTYRLVRETELSNTAPGRHGRGRLRTAQRCTRALPLCGAPGPRGSATWPPDRVRRLQGLLGGAWFDCGRRVAGDVRAGMPQNRGLCCARKPTACPWSLIWERVFGSFETDKQVRSGVMEIRSSPFGCGFPSRS